MVRILHMGDLHLGSRFSAFSARAAAVRREAQMAAFEALLKEGVKQGAELLLLAGDCFDTVSPDADTARRFFSLLGGLSIPVVIAPGNHDYMVPGGVWRQYQLPQNVHVFKTSALDSFDFPHLGVTVFGFAFEGESATAPHLNVTAGADRIPVLLAHADTVTPHSPYAPIPAGEWQAAPFRYAALGHIHKPVPVCRYGGTTVAYSGFLCGRGFDEPGVGHANLVDIEGETVTVTPLSSGAPRFEILTLDCTGKETGEALRQHLKMALSEAAFPPETALRVLLVGEVGAACHAEPAALEALGATFALFEVRDETLPLFDEDVLAADTGLRGAFYRALLPRLTSEDAEEKALAVEALRMGLAALSGREVTV